jgi:hypothetical protein
MTFSTLPLANITGLQSAMVYANTTTNGIFAPLILVSCFVLFTGVFYTATKERAISVSLFICLVPCALFVAAQLLNPVWLLINFFALAASLIFLGRLSN